MLYGLLLTQATKCGNAHIDTRFSISWNVDCEISAPKQRIDLRVSLNGSLWPVGVAKQLSLGSNN